MGQLKSIPAEEDKPLFVLVGFNESGKSTSTILYRLDLGEITTHTPTKGFDVQCVAQPRFAIASWQVNTAVQQCGIGRAYFRDARGLIFVFDATVNDGDTWHDPAEMKRVLHRMMAEEQLRDAKLLVFANKQDLPNARSEAEVATVLDLHTLSEGKLCWKVQQCCARSGAGLSEGFDWLFKACDLPQSRFELRSRLKYEQLGGVQYWRAQQNSRFADSAALDLIWGGDFAFRRALRRTWRFRREIPTFKP